VTSPVRDPDCSDHFLPSRGDDRLAETDRSIAKCDRDITQLKGRLASPEVSAEKEIEPVAELSTLKHEVLQQRAQIDQEKTRLDEVKKVVVDFKPLYHTLDRKSRLEVVHRFPRRIDSADTNVVVHWRFSQSDCQVPRLEGGPRMGVSGERGRVL
jgi:hypothetical protein